MEMMESHSYKGSDDPADDGRLALLQRFKVEDIQHLGRQDLLTAQTLAGHGSAWGRWLTPETISPNRMRKHYRDINLSSRLRYELTKIVPISLVDQLVEEGVLQLTRLALLARLISTGARGPRGNVRLCPSSIVQKLYMWWPRICARAIQHKANDPSASGVFKHLSETDIQEFRLEKRLRIELERLDALVARGVWSDAPPLPCIRQTTDPSASRPASLRHEDSDPYLPIPDDYLATIGPRILWIVQDMGPNLLRLLEDLPQEMKDINWTTSKANITNCVGRRIQDHLRSHPWVDRAGKPLQPPFRLTTASGRKGGDVTQWPPQKREHVVTLSITLQAAHLFIALLATAGRSGEVANLTRDCAEVGRDGKDYLRGYTYKLSSDLLGDERSWPAPPILCQCLGQQARLAIAWDWLPRSNNDALPKTARFAGALWVSLGTTGVYGEKAQLNSISTLMSLAERLGMDPKPSGKNLHPHRFRKTIGRLAGIALFNSPLVLKRLFGHKSIEMTLNYILCDPGVRQEADKVLRELRITHCAEALEEVHEAIRTGLPLPGNGGPGGTRLVSVVRTEVEQLAQAGRLWDKGTPYELAYLITANGQGWRQIQPYIFCTKTPGEDGLCQKKRSKGEPNTANCQPECVNRIVFARRRRDVEQNIECYLKSARDARADNTLLVLASILENMRKELEDFPDLKEQYLSDPEVQSLFALCDKPPEAEETVT